MKTAKPSRIVYRRDKGKVEISGDSEQVKWQIWFDLISTRLLWVVFTVILLWTIPHTAWMPIVWHWLTRQIPLLILFVVNAGFLQLMLSG